MTTHTTTCPDCSGEGESMCQNCNGLGSRYPESSGWLCTFCKGSGMARCETCEGNGELPACPICGEPVGGGLKAHADCEATEYSDARRAEDEAADEIGTAF